MEADVRRLEVPVPTAARAAEVLGCEVGAIANSLVFEADEVVKRFSEHGDLFAPVLDEPQALSA